MPVSSFITDDIGPYIYKDPEAVLDYRFDWTDWLNGDVITAATVAVTNGNKDSQSYTDTHVTVWISGGVVGQTITVSCHITTAAGRQDERTVRLKVKSR